mmetsp:Transcript_23064/g.55567  ORF Transcript_23064/g.55567 Transcript_23064/m.55567 type:complete len:374 (-) Transcript_23064:199-1320(-)
MYRRSSTVPSHVDNWYGTGSLKLITDVCNSPSLSPEAQWRIPRLPRGGSRSAQPTEEVRLLRLHRHCRRLSVPSGEFNRRRLPRAPRFLFVPRLIRQPAHLEPRRGFSSHWREREGAVLSMAEGAELEVVGRIERGGDVHVEVDQLEELLLQVVDLFQGEHGTEEGEVDVVQRAVVPHLLREDERGQEDRTPRGDEDGHLRLLDQPLDVDERDDEALGGEARAVVDRADGAVDRLLCGHLPSHPLHRSAVAAVLPLARAARRGLGVQRVVVLTEERVARASLVVELLPLHHAVVDDDGDAEDDLVDVGLGDGRGDEDGGGRVEALLLRLGGGGADVRRVRRRGARRLAVRLAAEGKGGLRLHGIGVAELLRRL